MKTHKNIKLYNKKMLLCSVAYVSRSGGMSNELNNIISNTTDGVFEVEEKDKRN